MGSRSKIAYLLASVAAVAVSTSTFAEEASMQLAADTATMAVETNTPVAVDLPVEGVVAADAVLGKFTVPAAGLFAINAPANTGIEVFVNGVLTIDATGTTLQTVGTEITGLMSLDAGDHVIEVRGIAADHPYLWKITIGPVGSEPAPFSQAVERIDALAAEAILANRPTLNAAASPDGVAPATSDFKPAAPFVIGGGSSAAGNASVIEGPANGTALEGMAAMAGLNAGSGFGNMGAGAGVLREGGISGISGGGGMSGGSGSGTDGGTDGGSGTGGTGGVGTGGTGTGGAGVIGGGTVVPNPIPTPTPTPIPAPTGLVQVTPLSPPANVVLTSGVQLTSAGDATGRVPNTGTTLFGAVMDNSMFDIVKVVVGPGNRASTVDVGPMTGQFAVRLFPEDFAAGPNVTVTLTGASSASDQVTAQPISYSFTGMPAQDGVTQALSRLTFGATPDLYARVRAIGFTAYVEQQLSPETIADAAFNAMMPDTLLERTTRDEGLMFRSIMAHDIAHAAFSEKQLREVMGQFWMNHFHASTKDTSITQQNIDDRAFFRANAFGNFEDLLLYSARSPLMSQFLDNDQNRRGNLNENYGREILELSSVGVNAGYTDNDVREVAKVFTGWGYVRTNPGVEDAAEEYDFDFVPDRHELGSKTISFLPLTINFVSGEAGVQEGEQLIAALSQNVNTRNFVCGKIVQLLVADAPPANFVASCAMAWETSGGEVEAMLRAILLDPAYITTAAYQRNKAKTPFEYAVSAVRLFGAMPQGTPEQIRTFYSQVRETFETAGQNMLRFPVPTGLPEVASAWTSSATMIAAYNEMMDITENRQNYGIDLGADILAAGLETAEEVAAYLLAIGTADRFRPDEFEAIVKVLKGTDGIFEPRVPNANETLALERAMGLLVVMPSFQLQ